MAEPKELPDEIRSPREVAGRTLALFAAFGASTGVDRKGVLTWLSENDLWKKLSPKEHGFIDNPNPSKQQVIDASWLPECIEVLLWSLGHKKELPPANEKCDPSTFEAFLPPFADASVPEFLASAKLRSPSELLDMQGKCLSLHWEARDARIHNRAPKIDINIEVIQERHRAINWICGYCNAPWDEVTTDT